MTPAPRLINRLDGVLFDLDGTLLDTAPDLVAALNEVCAEASVEPPPYALAAGNVSNGAIGMTRAAFPDHSDTDHQRLCQRLVEIYRDNICVRTRPFPGVTDLLNTLDEHGLRWGVVTNKMRALAVPILEQLELMERCAVVVGGDTAERNKPHPDPILLALEQTGLAADVVAYVGDHQKDVLSGQAAGTHTVAVTWGYLRDGDDPTTWGADYTIEKPLKLMEL